MTAQPQRGKSLWVKIQAMSGGRAKLGFGWDTRVRQMNVGQGEQHAMRAPGLSSPWIGRGDSFSYDISKGGEENEGEGATRQEFYPRLASPMLIS